MRKNFSSVRQNVLAFLADLFYILEVRPAKCIRPPGLMRDRFPINEGKKSFGQLSRYVGPFLFLWKKKREKPKQTRGQFYWCGIVYYYYFRSVLVATGSFSRLFWCFIFLEIFNGFSFLDELKILLFCIEILSVGGRPVGVLRWWFMGYLSLSLFLFLVS